MFLQARKKQVHLSDYIEKYELTKFILKFCSKFD